VLCVIAALAIAIPSAIVLSSEVDELNATINSQQGKQPACPIRANKRAAASRKLAKPITLTAEPAVGTINFGTDRKIKSIFFVLKASRRLPPLVTPKTLEISVPRPPSRVGDTLESASLAFPKFSPPRIINDRREIQFEMCVDGAKIKPGAYTSQVFISGPPGLHGTSVTATITAKNEIFWVGAVLVLLAAAALLGVMVNQDMAPQNSLLKVVTVIGSLVAAGVAMYAIYASDPAWGADPLTSIFALGGTAFSAAGVGSFVTTIYKHGQKKATSNSS